VFAQGDYRADDYEVLKEVDKLEQHLRTYPMLGNINSMTTIYKSINRMYKNNKKSAYVMPATEAQFKKYKKLVSKIPENSTDVLLSKDGKKTRIATRILDMGADSITEVSKEIDRWIAANTNPQIAIFQNCYLSSNGDRAYFR